MGSSTFESIAIAWFACFIDFLGMFVVVPVITPLALAYNANVSQVALLFSITLGTNVLSSFVFGKLRDIEIMCQNHEADPQSNLTLDVFMKEVMKIMYATDDDLED